MKVYKVIGCISATPKDSIFFEESEAYLFTNYSKGNAGIYASTWEGIQHMVADSVPSADLVITTTGPTPDGQLWDVCIPTSLPEHTCAIT